MGKILVAYATLSGTTRDVANCIGAEIEKSGAQVDVLPLAEVHSLEAYDGVVIGAPMIAGWHRSASSFLSKHRKSWQSIPLALFATAMTLTQSDTQVVDGVPLAIDPGLPKPPQKTGQLSFRERYALVQHYAGPMLSAVRPAKPVSIAFLGGRLEYGRLPWWAVIFAMFVVQAPAGDKHNLQYVAQWAASLVPLFRREAAHEVSGKLEYA